MSAAAELAEDLAGVSLEDKEVPEKEDVTEKEPEKEPEKDTEPATTAAATETAPGDDDDDNSQSDPRDAARKQRAQTILEGKLNIEGVARALREGTAKRVIVMAGAGISVSAGIPDFRTPGTGLYDNLQKYDLPDPTSIFHIDFFREKPEPFTLFAKEVYPGNFRPTLSHYFSLLLHRKGVLLRHFTQNIDTLERVAGLPGDSLVEAHGSFHGAHCIACKKEANSDAVRKDYFASELSIPRCEDCGALVKPDIVFFGEGLPARFFSQMAEDFPKCDMLLVMGTSLAVVPFATLIHRVKPLVPRVLMNRELVAKANREMLELGADTPGFRFKAPDLNVRDVALLGELDNVVWDLCGAVGDDWQADLVALVREQEKEGSKTLALLEERLAAAGKDGDENTN
jgi:NAD-dependent protein deacetylase sirtuin 2